MNTETTFQNTIRTSPLPYFVGPVAATLLGFTALVAPRFGVATFLGSNWVAAIAYALFAAGFIATALMANLAWNPYATTHSVQSVGWMLTAVAGVVAYLVGAGSFTADIAIVFIALIGLTGLSLSWLAARDVDRGFRVTA